MAQNAQQRQTKRHAEINKQDEESRLQQFYEVLLKMDEEYLERLMQSDRKEAEGKSA